MSLCLDCVLFTIKGKSVKDNKYIPIFNMWLSMCLKNAGLNEHDLLHIKIDSDTYDYIKNDLVFTELHKKRTSPTKILLCPPPLTVQDGMMMKYIDVDYKQDIYMYCDIDIFIMKSLHSLTNNILTNTIYVHPEGSLKKADYGGAFSEEELANLSTDSQGFSAGKFIIHGKNLYTELIKLIKKISSENSKIHYTVEQPFFNKGLYSLDKTLYTVDSSLFNNHIVSPNRHYYSKITTILLDAMGVPGDGDFHYDKILKFYILIFSGCL